MTTADKLNAINQLYEYYGRDIQTVSDKICLNKQTV